MKSNKEGLADGRRGLLMDDMCYFCYDEECEKDSEEYKDLMGEEEEE